MARERRDKALLSIMYKRSGVDENIVLPVRDLRSSNKIKLKVCRLKCKLYRRSPLYHSELLWDRLDAAQHHKMSRNLFPASL